MSATDPTALSRRRMLQGVPGAGAGAVLLGAPRLLGAGPVEQAAAASACTLTPEQEVGPFYVALERIRSNIIGGVRGTRLALTIDVIDASTCKPIKGAAVDVWHADALGVYSDEAQMDTTGKTYLRGVQLTDARGAVKFATIWPGFYQGRAPHIHVKVHVGGHHSSSRYSGGHVSHNGQIFFPETTSTKVYATSPYTSDRNGRTLNRSDRIYRDEHGSRSVLTVSGGSVARGYTGHVTLAVDRSAHR
jgi:protocatechuate 3,4-dioxygenase beta subunit